MYIALTLTLNGTQDSVMRETFSLPGIAGIIVNLFELNYNIFNAFKLSRNPLGTVAMSLPLRIISWIMSDKLLKFGA